MAKKPKQTAPHPARPPSDLGRQVLAYLSNNIAFRTYGDCCDLERLAEAFGRSPRGIKSVLRKLTEDGYVEIEQGAALDFVYPTAKGLREMNPSLTESEARQIVKRVRNG